jgi:hypothetical protein
MADVQQQRATEDASERTIPEGDWASKPAVPASTVAAVNTTRFTMWVEVAAGTVTVVKVDGVTIGARTSGMFLVRPGSSIAITYSVAPTWQWFYAHA